MLCSVYTSTYGSLDVAVLVVGDSTALVHWHCWLGDMNGIRPVKQLTTDIMMVVISLGVHLVVLLGTTRAYTVSCCILALLNCRRLLAAKWECMSYYVPAQRALSDYAVCLTSVCLTSVVYIQLAGGVCGRPAGWRILADRAWLSRPGSRLPLCTSIAGLGRGISWRPPARL